MKVSHKYLIKSPFVVNVIYVGWCIERSLGTGLETAARELHVSETIP